MSLSPSSSHTDSDSDEEQGALVGYCMSPEQSSDEERHDAPEARQHPHTHADTPLKHGQCSQCSVQCATADDAAVDGTTDRAVFCAECGSATLCPRCDERIHVASSCREAHYRQPLQPALKCGDWTLLHEESLVDQWDSEEEQPPSHNQDQDTNSAGDEEPNTSTAVEVPPPRAHRRALRSLARMGHATFHPSLERDPYAHPVTPLSACSAAPPVSGRSIASLRKGFMYRPASARRAHTPTGASSAAAAASVAQSVVPVRPVRPMSARSETSQTPSVSAAPATRSSQTTPRQPRQPPLQSASPAARLLLAPSAAASHAGGGAWGERSTPLSLVQLHSSLARLKTRLTALQTQRRDAQIALARRRTVKAALAREERQLQRRGRADGKGTHRARPCSETDRNAVTTSVVASAPAVTTTLPSPPAATAPAAATGTPRSRSRPSSARSQPAGVAEDSPRVPPSVDAALQRLHARLTAEVATLTHDNSLLTADIERMQDTLASHRTDAWMAADAEAETTTLRKEHTALTAQVASQRTQQELVRFKRAQLVRDLKAAHSDLTVAVEARTLRAREVAQSAAQLAAQSDDLEREYTRLQHQLDRCVAEEMRAHAHTVQPTSRGGRKNTQVPRPPPGPPPSQTTAPLLATHAPAASVAVK